MPHKVSDEITYPLPNFNGFTVEVWEWMSKTYPQYTLHYVMGAIIHGDI